MGPRVALLLVLFPAKSLDAQALRALVADGDSRWLAADVANVACVFWPGVGLIAENCFHVCLRFESASMIVGTSADGFVECDVGRRATPLPRCPVLRMRVLQTSTEFELSRWASGSSLLKNLHCLTHFCESEDHERRIGAGLGSAVAVVDVDSGFAEP